MGAGQGNRFALFGGWWGWHTGDDAILISTLMKIDELGLLSRTTIVSPTPEITRRMIRRTLPQSGWQVVGINFGAILADKREYEDRSCRQRITLRSKVTGLISRGLRKVASRPVRREDRKTGLSSTPEHRIGTMEQFSVFMESHDRILWAGGGYILSQKWAQFPFQEVVTSFAKSARKPLYYLAQSYGPFEEKDKALLRTMRECAILMSAREEFSAADVLEIAPVGCPVSVEPDAVFSLFTSLGKPRERTSRATRPVIGVNLQRREGVHVTDDAELVLGVIKRLDPSQLLFFPHDEKDTAYIKEVLDRLCPHVTPMILLSHELIFTEHLALLGMTDASLGVRYHFFLLSLLARRPAVALTHKIKNRKLIGTIKLIGMDEDLHVARSHGEAIEKLIRVIEVDQGIHEKRLREISASAHQGLVQALTSR